MEDMEVCILSRVLNARNQKRNHTGASPLAPTSKHRVKMALIISIPLISKINGCLPSDSPVTELKVKPVSLSVQNNANTSSPSSF
jgi:hypothetical protein